MQMVSIASRGVLYPHDEHHIKESDKMAEFGATPIVLTHCWKLIYPILLSSNYLRKRVLGKVLRKDLKKIRKYTKDVKVAFLSICNKVASPSSTT